MISDDPLSTTRDVMIPTEYLISVTLASDRYETERGVDTLSRNSRTCRYSLPVFFFSGRNVDVRVRCNTARRRKRVCFSRGPRQNDDGRPNRLDSIIRVYIRVLYVSVVISEDDRRRVAYRSRDNVTRRTRSQNPAAAGDNNITTVLNIIMTIT